MHNPFSEQSVSTDSDTELVAAAIQGDGQALEKIILRHQAWIYNIAFKMIMDHDDACDITQEILIKTITNLSSYDSKKAAFRTWLYRVVVNHVLSMKRKKFERRINDFDQYINLIEKLPDHQQTNHPEAHFLASEFKIGCMMGMLMCLTRSDRLTFLLGAVFSIKDTVGAELMEISRENFRKKLSRAKQKLFTHMNSVCGHVNPERKCLCKNKYKNFVEMGMLDADNPRYLKPDTMVVKEIVEERVKQFSTQYYDPFLSHFQEQPFYEPPDMVKWLRDMIGHDDFKRIFNIH